MRSKASPPLAYTVKRGTICVADGYRVTVRVRHGRLIVEDGFGPDRRRREHTRVTTPIARLVVVGNGGSISLEALCWLRDLGAALVHVARDGRLVATTANETPDARLRRAQALAATTHTGLEISRSILTEKIRGQQRALSTLTADPNLVDAMAAAASRLETAASLDELVWAERDAALAYWSSWSAVSVRFVPRDRDRVPDHWHQFGQRSSPLTSGPRLATNPANAIVNFQYALLEAESRLALLAVGLDPSIGIVHADTRGRDSLALDLMEAARPAVDEHVLTLLRSRVFRAADFNETRQGACRIRPPLTEHLAMSIATWRRAVAPIAEQLARMLAKPAGRNRRPLPTPLTRRNHIASRDPVRKRVPPKAAPQRRACKRCGGPLPNPRRTYCDDCLPIFQLEQLAPRPSRVGGERGVAPPDTTHGGEAARRRGATNALRKLEARAWDEEYGKLLDLGAFEREILPQIQNVSLSVLSRVTGLSIRYVSLIRRGERTPHPRHWQRLLAAAAEDAESRSL